MLFAFLFSRNLLVAANSTTKCLLASKIKKQKEKWKKKTKQLEISSEIGELAYISSQN
jgi:hypothetical protein